MERRWRGEEGGGRGKAREGGEEGEGGRKVRWREVAVREATAARTGPALGRRAQWTGRPGTR